MPGYLPVICLQSVFTCSKSSGPSQYIQKRKKNKIKITSTVTVLERNRTLPESSQKKRWQCPHLLLTHHPLRAVLPSPGCRRQLQPPPRGLCLAIVLLRGVFFQLTLQTLIKAFLSNKGNSLVRGALI